MLSKSIDELKEKLELRNKILSCFQIVGPIGPRGPHVEKEVFKVNQVIDSIIE